MQLSANFTLAEMTRTSTGLPNEPNEDELAKLKELCETILQPVRLTIGRPIRVTSGFRGEEVNEAVGGSETSQHRLGEAADIKVADFNAKELARLVAWSLKARGTTWGQIIYYHASRGGHVHVSLGTKCERLYAKAKGGYSKANF